MSEFKHSATVDWAVLIAHTDDPAPAKPPPPPPPRWVWGPENGWHVLSISAHTSVEFHRTLCNQEITPRTAKFRDDHPGSKTVLCEQCSKHAEALLSAD